MANAAPLKAFQVLAFLKVHSLWVTAVNSTVPEPYLDEVFHIPQAQAYWAGNWTQWDPKITTPPGLYVFSNAFNSISKIIARREPVQTTEDLRNVSAVLLWLLFVSLRVFRSLRRREEQTGILYRELNIMLFPLFFFFSALYYTDLFSALTVMVSYIFWGLGQTTVMSNIVLYRSMHFLSGLVALATRQTNIFWVAIFLGGLQVVQTVNSATRSPMSPEVAEAEIEDYVQTVLSIAQGAITCTPKLILDLVPQLSLLACFGAFVLWNGGVVLGDKDNHIASLHLSQMLYMWPFITFFSWPLLLPQLLNYKQLRSQMPRPVVAVTVMAIMATVVHFNTVVHPFTLADNRHYMFYVFRLLLRHPVIKYAAVPVYFFCAWLVVNALGSKQPGTGERVSFVLVWLASNALSLVTAPLVEPRYFMVPWLVWRLHVPGMVQLTGAKHKKDDSNGKKDDQAPIKQKDPHPAIIWILTHLLWIELAWFLLVNGATCWLFLERPFEWMQEPGKLQRFMW